MKTPIALFIFNRPDTTTHVFEKIRRARPPKLLVVADGPRKAREGEAEKCVEARDIVSRIDWPCEFLTNYSDANLGCRRRVSSGLDWVFQTVPEAIILEDDCVPDPSFFRFCEELLDYYRHDERVLLISGTHMIEDEEYGPASYYFSKYPHIWGWASWKRAWRQYDVDMTAWPRLKRSGMLFDPGTAAGEKRFWKHCFDRVYKGNVDTWDAQVTFMSFLHRGLTIFPVKNLISNIGFGVDATHTTGHSGMAGIPTVEMEFPLVHPGGVERHVRSDEKRRRLEYSRKGVPVRVAGKLLSIFR